MPELEFRIDATKPANRELQVRVTLTGIRRDQIRQGRIEFFLPTWTPGSYLIRDYSRQLSRIEAFATATQKSLPCHKSRKNRIVVETGGAEDIELRYRVYAHELSVRTADLDASHAYWNHTCVLLWPLDGRRWPARITVDHPSEWSLTCSLPGHATSRSAGGYTSVTLNASDLDDALDAPVLIGATQRLDWSVDDVPHSIVLDGLAGISPPATLAADLQRIVQQAAAVFGGQLPYQRYVFLALFAGEGYGGLEHRDSSTLLMPRTALTTEKGYREFLALAAHELFHAWNVKRMRPVEFWDYDYEQENYTNLLWLMEGWTAYYDDLLLVRAGLMSHSDYLATMAKNVQNMRAAPGRFELSLEESSFDAWIRLYRPDENTRNSSQNYYGNGAVAAMCLDLLIRRQSNDECSLDDVLQSLYRTTFAQGRGYEIGDVHRAIQEHASADVVDRLRELVTGPLDPQLDALLDHVGVNLSSREQGAAFLGIGFRPGTTTVGSVTKDSPAFFGGLAPGDELLAVQQLRVTASNWQTVFGAVAQPDRAVELLIARRGLIRSQEVTPAASPGTVKLTLSDCASEAQVQARAAWLGNESPDSQ